MSTTDTTTWGWDDTYSRATLEQTTPHGVFRAVIARDEYPEAPDYDQAPPVYAYDSTGYGYRLEDSPRAGADSDRASGVDFPAALEHFHERGKHWRDCLEQLDRWLRVFHGGGVREVSSSVYQGAPWFLTYDTRAMREAWGLTGELLERSDPQAYDWQAYADGEVYVVSVERARYDDAGAFLEWETCEDGPVGGHYGEAYAQEAALEMLTDEVAHTAATMLPIGA